MKILYLESATPVCSVILADDHTILSRRESDAPNAHSSKMAVFVDEVLREASVQPHDLDAVCVSSGPGSYTGLRIGTSSAKGFCYALGIPLLAVPTLQSMASLFYMQHPDFDGLVCPMIDARRMECYTAIFDRHLNEVKPVSADIIEAGIYDRYLAQSPVAFVGDGAAKTRDILGVSPQARFLDFTITAEGMIPLAISRLDNQQVEDVAYFEPFYLKDFVAAKPVVKGLQK